MCLASRRASPNWTAQKLSALIRACLSCHVCEKFLNSADVRRLGEKIALTHFAAHMREQVYLLLLFDALSNHPQAQIVRQGDDDADNFTGLKVAAHGRDEASVDFQCVDWETLEATKR